MIISEFSLNKGKRKPADINYNKYWIEDMPDPYIYAWENYNRTCKAYYYNTANPYYNDNYGV